MTRRQMLGLVRKSLEVHCLDGSRREAIDLDYAASTPALTCVADEIAAFLPAYASVHRGIGPRSQVATQWYERARDAVAQFVDARPDDAVVFVANTTDAINTLAATLPVGTRVLGSPAEHHANLLPWRRHALSLLPFTRSAAELVEACECALAAADDEIRLVALTGASNVTGEITPLRELAQVAHAHGAELFVDAAQLAPHRATSLRGSEVDYVAFSGHKLYAPFGAGVLVGRRQGLCRGEPFRRGGGAASRVTLDDVTWAEGPARLEAGSPNVVGAVALAAACRALTAELPAIEAGEQELARLLFRGLDAIPGVRRLVQWDVPDADRLAVASFTMDGYDDDLLALVLGLEWGIGVRQGRFCAHPLVSHLLGDVASTGSGERPRGAVRASLGIGTTRADVTTLLEALRAIAARGPHGEYVRDAAGAWALASGPRRIRPLAA